VKLNSVQDAAAAVRGRRQALGLSQGELASMAGVSRDWVNYFEGGKPTVELAHVLRVFDALGLRLELDEGGPRKDTPSASPLDLDELLEEYRDR
jgi:HTH-type transcriptional regulator / antitoxin HipB